jgi:hypothetical protein
LNFLNKNDVLARGILSNAKITSWSNKFSFHRQPSKV